MVDEHKATLRTSVSFLLCQGHVFALRVVGQESNIVLMACRTSAHSSQVAAQGTLKALQGRLRQATHVFGNLAEADLLSCMRSNADTIEVYSCV